MTAHEAACDAQRNALAQLQTPAAERLYRTTLRNNIFRLLGSVDMPGKKAQAGRLWMEEKYRSTEQLERFKARILKVLTPTQQAA